MYTKLPYKMRKFHTKKEAIRYIKNHKSKRFRKQQNNPETIRYLLNQYEYWGAQKVKLGIYIPRNLEIGDLIDVSNDFTKEADAYFDFVSGNSYGVCDDLSNFLDVFDKELATIPEKVSVTLTPMYKSQQSEYSGWRWHKWGPYIGKYTQTTEYLYDEPIVEVVWLYHIYVIKN